MDSNSKDLPSKIALLNGPGKYSPGRFLFPHLLLITLALLGMLAAETEVSIQFKDQSGASKIGVITYTGGSDKNHILESTGNGVLVLDYDQDFDPDVYFVNAYRFPKRGEKEEHPNVLYRNNGDGSFSDVTGKAGVGAAGYGQGGCVGDYDNDGLPDLYVTNFGSNILYRNNGDGTFADVTVKAGVGDPRWSIGATFFDADADGDLDLYVANYIDAEWEEIHAAKRTRMWRGKAPVLDGPKGLPGGRNTYYVNEGDGTFRDATEEAGFLPGAEYYSMGVAGFDYDLDGDIDLYVASDSTPNCLYRNKGDGTFEEVGVITGSAYNADGQEQGSMGVDFGDYDLDGWFDLVVTNFANDYYTLYRNLEGKFFQDESFSAGIAVPTFVPLGWAAILFDADHDTDLDLFFSNGHIYPQVDDAPSLHETYKQKNQFFLNENGKFRILKHAGSGLESIKSSRGAGMADYDMDGDLDILISNQDEPPSYLENATVSRNHWIQLSLRDTKGSPLAIGTVARITAAGVTQLRQIASGSGYASQNTMVVHAGLSAATSVERLELRWPDGTKETHEDLVADHMYLIQRGSKPTVIKSRR